MRMTDMDTTQAGTRFIAFRLNLKDIYIYIYIYILCLLDRASS